MTEKEDFLQTEPIGLTVQEDQTVIDTLTSDLQPENKQIQGEVVPETVPEKIEPENGSIINGLQSTKKRLQSVITIEKPNKSAKKAVAEKPIKKVKKALVSKPLTPNNEMLLPVKAKKEDNRYILTIAYSGEEAAYMRNYLQLRVKEGNAETTTQAVKQLIDFAANFKPVYKMYTGKEAPFFIGFPDGLEPRLLKDSIMAGKCTITVCK